MNNLGTLSESEMNQGIHPVDCSEILQNLSNEAKEGIPNQNKVCYTGIFVPYIHSIVYDLPTQQVDHFVQGMRD